MAVVSEHAESPQTLKEVSFSVGDTFQTFEEFESKLEAYKKERFVEFWRRDSRTIAAARKRGIDRPLKEELRYHELKYSVFMGVKRLSQEEKGTEAHRKCTEVQVWL